MPLFGTLDLSSALSSAPTVTSLVPETWKLPGAETLQVSYEVDEDAALAVTPPALHPSIPPYATFSVCHFSDTPVGEFNLAMVRLIVRAGIRPRGLLIKAFTDSEAAAEQLSAGWGYDVSVAQVAYSHRHNQVRGTVTIDGRLGLDARLLDPEPVAGADIELFDNLHLVNMADGDPLIVQVDPGYEYQSADRGAADLAAYEPDLLGIEGIEPVYDMVAVACRADMELAAPRFVIDPAKPAVQGTRRLDG
ncbi:MAG: acetoacetate decarboxylase family protein [Acidimicrobiales bacterium]